MRVNLIVAVGQKGEIGKNNDLLWHLPLDMSYFRKVTTGYPIITGRKNYESIPEKFRPLKNRTNIILTRNDKYQAPGAIVVDSLDRAIAFAKSKDSAEVYIIGGGQIYEEALKNQVVDRMLITKVAGEFDADVLFPNFKDDDWNIRRIAHFNKDERHAYDFEMFSYVRKLK